MAKRFSRHVELSGEQENILLALALFGQFGRANRFVKSNFGWAIRNGEKWKRHRSVHVAVVFYYCYWIDNFKRKPGLMELRALMPKRRVNVYIKDLMKMGILYENHDFVQPDYVWPMYYEVMENALHAHINIKRKLKGLPLERKKRKK